jgi:hypothetical protein
LHRPSSSRSTWHTMDSWSAIARMRPGFRQAAQQRSGRAKELASAWNPPGAIACPNPTLTLTNCATKVLQRANPSIAFVGALPFGAVGPGRNIHRPASSTTGVGSRGDRFCCSASQRHLLRCIIFSRRESAKADQVGVRHQARKRRSGSGIVCRQAARHSRQGDSMKRRAFIAGFGEIVTWPIVGRVGDLLMWDHCAVRHLASFDYFYSRMHQRKRL